MVIKIEKSTYLAQLLYSRFPIYFMSPSKLSLPWGTKCLYWVFSPTLPAPQQSLITPPTL